MKRQTFIPLLLALIFTSCGTLRYDKTSDFRHIAGFDDLSGTYLNYKDVTEYGTLLQRFKINQKNVDFVTLSFPDEETIKLSFRNDSASMEKTFSGEMKNNYFEVFFTKKSLMTGLYNDVEIDRLRIGIAKDDGKLYIKRLAGETKAYVIVAYETFDGERTFKYQPAHTYKGLLPYEQNGKWGYMHTDGSAGIVPAFEYACVFNQGTGKVKINGKWGLIDVHGLTVAPAMYDYIGYLLDGKREAIYQGNRGYIDLRMMFNPYHWKDNSK